MAEEESEIALAARSHEAAPLEPLHHRLGREALLDRLPMVFHQPACFRGARHPSAEQRHELAEMLCDNASGHGVARAAQLKDQKSSTRTEDAPELAESAGQIRDVTQRIAERQEIDRGIGDRERLGGSLDQQN